MNERPKIKLELSTFDIAQWLGKQDNRIQANFIGQLWDALVIHCGSETKAFEQCCWIAKELDTDGQELMKNMAFAIGAEDSYKEGKKC